ncbi:hypothetical protein BKA63DRAFT_543823 [Paraphoma chrysanthemicola]|nr:hypothetical protein BKA63DRAFT_543823 [Paraphoma chrysanthemicola]
MQQTSTSTFHSFPRLPLELRIQIWSLVITENRPLKIRLTKRLPKSLHLWVYPHYVWTRFESDIVQMLGSVMSRLTEGHSMEKREIRHMRLEMSVGNTCSEEEWFYHEYGYRIRDFPQLQRCDILVSDGLYVWGDFIKDRFWGACSRSNVRIVDVATGEYIDGETDGPYQDYLDTGHGESREYVRIQDDWDEEDEEDGDERYQAMMKMSAPLPRMDLNY